MLNRIVAITAIILSLGGLGADTIAKRTNLGASLYLVNRDYVLSQDYVPDDLVRPKVRTQYGNITMRSEAAQALEELFKAAKEEQGYVLEAVSGYRSYAKQKAIYNRKIKRTGSVEKAQLLVAPPGSSEHQLGLAMDIGRKGGTGLNAGFGKTKEGKWVAENAHRFGYIIRYKAEWTHITGYAYEPWHIRYVGKEHAEQIYRLDVPLEIYLEALTEAMLNQSLLGGIQP
ncbi:MAG: M15 family metallopeptidase [Christensenellales bacterium]